MNVLLIFPALCIYDNVLQAEKKNFCSCFFNIGSKKVSKTEDENPENDLYVDEDSIEKKKLSLIHRILSAYYHFVHKFRWAVLALCIAGITTSIAYGSTISLPESADVRLLPSSHPLELHLSWKDNLLSTVFFSTGSSIEIHFGLRAGDNGNKNDPGKRNSHIFSLLFME